MPHMLSRAVFTGVVFLGFSSLAVAKPAPAKPASRDALWNMVQKECLPNYRKSHTPKPCNMVVPRPGRHGGEFGFAVVNAKPGKAHFRLLPLDKISGIEDPKLLKKEQTNYFASAWTLGGFMFHRHISAAEDYTAVAVNSSHTRTQNQLNLHIDCLSVKAHNDLAKIAPKLSAKWSKTPYSIAGTPFYVMKVHPKNIAGVHPFKELAKHMPGAQKHMGDWALAVTGAPKGGFYILATRADLQRKGAARGGFAEVVMDHSCRIPLVKRKPAVKPKQVAKHPPVVKHLPAARHQPVTGQK